MAGQSGRQLKLLGTLEGARPALYWPVAFSPDGKTLATGRRDLSKPDEPGEINLWDVAKRKVIATFKMHADSGGSLAFSPDGRTLAAGGERVTLWDVATRKEKASLKGDSDDRFVAFSPDGKTLAVGGASGTGLVKLWDLSTRKVKSSLRHLEFKEVNSVAFSPDGKHIASGAGQTASNGAPGPGEVKLWDAATGRELASLRGGAILEGGPEFVRSVTFSPDGKLLASAGVYGNVLLWDVKTGKQTATLQQFKEGDVNPAYCVAFSPDGNILAAGTFRGIKFWDVKTGKMVGDLKGPSVVVWSLAFSRDGKTLASAEGRQERLEGGELPRDPTVRLWELIPSKKADK
jgi:WD40 repeat protein